MTGLKLLDKDSANPRFRILETSFDAKNDGDLASQTLKEHVIIGQIFPNSEIYKQRSYKIEIKLPTTFPVTPPEIRFITPIYHPNVNTDGK